MMRAYVLLCKIMMIHTLPSINLFNHHILPQKRLCKCLFPIKNVTPTSFIPWNKYRSITICLPEGLKLPHFVRFLLQMLDQQIPAPTFHVTDHFLLILGQHLGCGEVGDATNLLQIVLDIDVELEIALLVVVVEDSAKFCVGFTPKMNIRVTLRWLFLSSWQHFLCYFGFYGLSELFFFLRLQFWLHNFLLLG